MQLKIEYIASLVGIITSLVAIIGLLIELRRSRISLQTDTLLRLEDRFYSADMISTRIKAAQKLLRGELENEELSDVLDFFSTTTLLLERKAIDRDLVYNLQSYWMIRYWLAARDYVKAARELDYETWTNLQRWVERFMKIEREKSYSEEEIRKFLQTEARGKDIQS
jgi:hypothetical protein